MLGRAYQFAEVVPRDDAQARLWLERAAARGHLDAQYFVDEMAPGHEKLERELVAAMEAAPLSTGLIRDTIRYLEVRDEIDGKLAYETWRGLRPKERDGLPGYEELMAAAPPRTRT